MKAMASILGPFGARFLDGFSLKMDEEGGKYRPSELDLT